jgi:hypothetical protein
MLAAWPRTRCHRVLEVLGVGEQRARWSREVAIIVMAIMQSCLRENLTRVHQNLGLFMVMIADDGWSEVGG